MCSRKPNTSFHPTCLTPLTCRSCVRVTFRCVKADNALAMILLVFKDGSSTQFCSFEAANIAKLLQVRSLLFCITLSPARAAALYAVAAPRRVSSQETKGGNAGAVRNIAAVGSIRNPCPQRVQLQHVGDRLAPMLPCISRGVLYSGRRRVRRNDVCDATFL